MSAWLLLAAVARADVVAPPPESCPAGSIGRSSHGGPYCGPSTCDGDCATGEACKPTGLCVLREERPCPMRTSEEEDCTYPHIEATASCRQDSDCRQGSCEIVDRCVTPRSLCGCSQASGAAVAFGLAWLPLLVGRRRRT